MKFAKYDDTGRILYLGSVPETLLKLQGENVYVGEADALVHYIKHGQLQKRQVSPVQIGNDNTLQRIPEGATIYINEKAYPATEPVCSLEFTYPGRYLIRVEAFPYLDFQTEVMK